MATLLDQETTFRCIDCGGEIEIEQSFLKNKHFYCFRCRQIRRDSWKRGIRSEHGNKSKKGLSKIIKAHENWLNAGLYCGKQGYLRDKFYELFSKLDDFQLVMEELRKDEKYLAEIKGLSELERRVWLIGFFKNINQDIPKAGDEY